VRACVRAHLRARQGRDDEALKLWRRDLAICEETVGRSHPDTAVTLHNLAGVHKKRGTRKTRQESPEMFAAVRFLRPALPANL
jgi:hypothetical protein